MQPVQFAIALNLLPKPIGGLSIVAERATKEILNGTIIRIVQRSIITVLVNRESGYANEAYLSLRGIRQEVTHKPPGTMEKGGRINADDATKRKTKVGT